MRTLIEFLSSDDGALLASTKMPCREGGEKVPRYMLRFWSDCQQSKDQVHGDGKAGSGQ